MPPLLALTLAACVAAPPNAMSGSGGASAKTAGGHNSQAQLQLGAGIWAPNSAPGADAPAEMPQPQPSAGNGSAGGNGSPAPAAPPAPAGPPPAFGDHNGPIIGAFHPDHPLVVFSSTRATGSGIIGGFDIFAYDVVSGTVLALPGINTPGNEIEAQISHNGRWIVYATDVNGNFDIRLFDLQNQVINALTTLNTPFDEFDPSVSDDGMIVAYVSRQAPFDELRIFNMANGASYIPAPVQQLAANVSNPCIAGNGHAVAFAAVLPTRGDKDIFVYDMASTSLLSPPFVNSPFNDDQPALSADGTRIAFATDRDGFNEVFMADMPSGYVDRLTLANAPPSNSNNPVFVGPGNGLVLFQSDRTFEQRLFIFDAVSGVLDTLPILHEPGQDDIIKSGGLAGSTVVGAPFGGAFGGPLFGRGRGFGYRGFWP